MKIVLFIIILSVSITISPICAEENDKSDKNGWIEYTDRSDNRLLNEIIDKSDLTEKINIIEKLRLRKDRDFNSLLEYHYYRINISKAEKELLLYYLISSTVNSNEDYILNKKIVNEIFSEIVEYSDSLLRKIIIKKSDYTDKQTAIKVLSSEGRMIADLSRKNGSLDPVLKEECIIYFRHAEKYGEPVLDQLRDIIYRNAVNFEYPE